MRGAHRIAIHGTDVQPSAPEADGPSQTEGPAVPRSGDPAAPDLAALPHPEAIVLTGDPFEIADAVDLAAAGAEAAGGTAGLDRPGSDRRRLAVNAAAGAAANVLKIGVQLLMLPLMAHLLGPAEFGLYALALPTIAFFMALADGGLGASLAREREGTTAVWSTAFWLLLVVGVTLALIATAWGVVLADLSHEPRVRGIMGFLSISFILITVSVLPSARLTRQGRLVVFAMADLGSTVVGAAVAVGLAAGGAGAWSLAAQYVTGFLIRAIVLNGVAFAPPTFEFRLSALRQHISTGSSLLGGRLCDFCGRMVENLVYGRAFGAASLGAFTFANQAPRFICEAASGPIWGALYAHALREDERSIAALHAKLVHLLAAAVFPVAFLLSAAAPEVLNLILGPRWASAAVLLRLLVPFYALHVVASQSGAVLLANGRGWRLFWATFGLTVGRVAAVSIGVWVGPVAVAAGIGLSHAAAAAYLFTAPAGTAGLSAAPLLKGLAAPVGASVVAGAVCYGLLRLHADRIAWITLSLSGGACAYLLAMAVLEGPRLLGELGAIRRIVLRGR